MSKVKPLYGNKNVEWPPETSSPTQHTIKTKKGSAARVSVRHADYCAVEYEFYIPALIYRRRATKRFITRLQSIEPGATVFKGLQGIWRGESENTHIYRMILRGGRFDRKNVRTTLQNEIGALLAALSQLPGKVPQEAVMFTEREVHGVLSWT